MGTLLDRAWGIAAPFALLLLLINPIPAHPQTMDIALTPAEEAWLNEHPVVVLGTVPDWAPISMRGPGGELIGIAGDYRLSIERKLPLRFFLAAERPWTEVLDAVRQKKMDVVMLLGQTPARDSYLLFTNVLLELQYVIITREGEKGVRDVYDLEGKRVAVRERFVSHERLAAEHPELLLFPKKTTVEALQSVLSGQTDAFIGSLADASYSISKAGLTGLKVAASASFGNQLRIGVRKDWPELVSILNKAIAATPVKEQHEMWDRWVPLQPQGRDPWLLYMLAGAFISIIALLLALHNYRLRKAFEEVDGKVAERTSSLMRLTDELKKSEERYREIFEQAADYILVLETAPNGPSIIIDASRSAFERHGYTREEMIGKPITFLDPEEAKVPARLAELFEHGSIQFEAIHKRKDGSTFVAEVSGKIITIGGKTLLYTIERDITKRKRAENMLRYRADLSGLAPGASLDALIQAGLDMAESFTASNIGFFHFVDDDQENLTLQTWSTNTLANMCKAEGKGLHYAIGMAGVWVDCFYTKAPVIHNDYASLTHKKGMPEGHAAVTRMLTAPVLQGEKVVAIMGVGNKKTPYTPDDAQLVREAASMLVDLAQKKQAEDALRLESEITARAAQGVVLVKAADGVIVHANAQFERMFGYGHGELDGKHISIINAPTDVAPKETARRIIDELQRTGIWAGELLNRKKDGGTLWTYASVSTYDHPDHGRLLITSQIDITERKNAEEKTNRFFNLSLDILCIVGQDGYFKEVNPVFTRALGFTEQELLSRPFIEFVHPGDRAATLEEVKNLRAGGATIDFENRYICKDGSARNFSWRAVIHPESGLFYATARDVTERNLRDEEMRKAREKAEQATALKDQFVTMVAHDLKSPLTTLLSFVKLVRDNASGALGENHRQMLDHAANTAHQMTLLIEDVLNLSRLRTGGVKLTMEFFDAHQIGKKLAADYHYAALDKGIELVNEIPEHTRLYSDKTLLAEAVHNFVNNAIKFCGKGDRVTISHAGGAMNGIYVTDTGPGMAAESVEKLLKLDNQLPASGMAERGGFGLMIAKAVIETLGGSFVAESSPGKGSRFGARIPAVRPRILVVDDDPGFRFLMLQYLKAIDADIIEADDGAAAVKMLANGRSLPHLIISDIEMPGMNGLALLSHVQAQHHTSGIPVIIVSGKHGMEIRDNVYALGAKDYLAKDIDIDDFIPRIRRYIG